VRRRDLLLHAAFDYPNAVRIRVGSFREWRVPASYAQGDGRPVVVIPGVYETWHFLRPIADELSRRGHPVFVIPAIRRNTRPIPETAATIAREVARLDLHDAAVVAHSKGGLVGKHLMAFDDPEGRIGRLVAIATPFAGSAMARWMPGRTLRAFLPGDPVIQSLTAELALNARVTSIFPTFDSHIPEGSRLEGAHNVEVDTIGHFRILGAPETLAAVVEAVERTAPVE
jgi:triacylglycerol lipase